MGLYNIRSWRRSAPFAVIVMMVAMSVAVAMIVVVMIVVRLDVVDALLGAQTARILAEDQ